MDIQIESIGKCSAACVWCPYIQHASERSKGMMATETFHRLIDEVASIPQIDLIKITGLNEPTLDPRLPDLLAYCRDHAPHAKTEVFTHGAHLRPALFDRMRDSGLASLVVSLNAVNQEQHERVMNLKGLFDRVVSNIEYAHANRGNCTVNVHAVFSGDTFTEADLHTFYAKWGNALMGEGIGTCITEGNWAGKTELKRIFSPSEHCHRATSSSYVTYDGKATPCCFMPLGNVSFGNVNEQTFREIYNSEPYVAFRTAHAENRADEYDFCAKCTRI